MTPDATSGLFECALAIARNRAETLELLKQALEQNNHAEVWRLAGILTGRDDDGARELRRHA